MLGFTGVRKWVYVQWVRGKFQVLHRWSGRALFALLVIPPWLSWNGNPLFLFDIPGRRVHAMGYLFTPQDGFLMALMGFFAAFTLFLFTSLYGRLWCGYACPQSVFLEELIHPIERFFEGERGERRALDGEAWSPNKIARKAAKHLAFAAMAWAVSASFTGWFSGPKEVWTFQASADAYSVTLFFAVLWYLDWAWFREQLCNFLCPYARFQGALCDDESLVVTYEAKRGEPRGNKAAAASMASKGECIDCKKCVTVCPTGIDIRDGFQLECIMCGRCIDACTDVMAKQGLPSLVTYDTIAGMEGRTVRTIRPRTVIYAALLTGIMAAMIAIVALKQPLEAHVSRLPGPMWTIDAQGWTQNTFMVDVINNDSDKVPDTFRFAVEGLPEGAVTELPEISLDAGQHQTVPVVIRIPPDATNERTIPVDVVVSTEGGQVKRRTNLKLPKGNGG